MSDLDMQRASSALTKIRALRQHADAQAGENDVEKAENSYGNYVSFVKALPAAILQNGLGQALATELAASKNDNATGIGHHWLFLHLSDWLVRDDKLAPYRNGNKDKYGVLTALADTNNDQENYVIAQYEAMAYLGWLKKFAVAMLIQPQGEK